MVIGAFLVAMGVVRTVLPQLSYVARELPVLHLWPDGLAQQRELLGPDLFEMLVASDAVLPPRATVLLITPGDDPRHAEYFAFHRALYHLAPRAVWWASPAMRDGTWESRWWTPVDMTAETISSLAAERRAAYVLFYRAAVPAGLGEPIEVTPYSRIVSLSGAPITPDQPPREAFPERWRLFGGLVASLLAILGVGALPVVLAVRLGYAGDWIEAVAWAWILGSGAVSVSMLWLSALEMPVRGQLVVVTLGAGLGLLALIFWHRGPQRATTWGLTRLSNLRPAQGVQSAERSREVELGPAVHELPRWDRALSACSAPVVVLEIGMVAILAIGRPLVYWDSWVSWAFKAQLIVSEGRVSPAALSDPSRLVTHPDYPLLIPLIEAWTLAWALPDDRVRSADWLAGAHAVAFLSALLVLAYAGLRRHHVPRATAMLFVAGLATMENVGGLASVVFADLPLAVYATATALALLAWLKSGSPGALLLAALAGGCLPWTKREGIALLGVFALGLVLSSDRSRRTWMGIGALGAGGLLLAGPWWALVMFAGIPNAAFLPMTPVTLLSNLDRVPVIVGVAVQRLASANWSYVWLAVTVCLFLSLATRPRLPRADFLLVAAVIYVGLMNAAYVFSAFVPYQQHVISSIDRIVGHVTPLLILWVAIRASAPGKASSVLADE
jgi:hypothetical protein